MSWDVCITADSGAECTDASEGSTTRNKWVATRTYQCIYGDQHAGDGAADVDDIAAIVATGQQVNASTYQGPDGASRPYMFCKSLSAKRDKKARHIFRVTAKYEEVVNGFQNDAAECPEDLTDIEPKVSATVGRYDKVLYEDYSSPSRQCYYMPAVFERYNAPVTSPQATLQLTVEQYELSLPFEEMMRRSFLVNNAPYRGRSAGHWMIQEVQARDAVVKLCDPLAEDGFVELECVLVTYPIVLSDYTVGNYEAGVGVKDVFVGHNTAMPLISNYYIEGGEQVKFADNESGLGRIGFIDNSGDDITHNGRPNYEVYKTTKQGSFSFLRA